MAITAAIGYADYVTGPDLGFSLFYLAPIAMFSWLRGRSSGVTLALLAAGCWLLAELAWPHTYPPYVSAWNAVTRLVIFVAAAMLLSQLRSDQDRLNQLLDLERELSRTDALTGLANLRSLVEHAETVPPADAPEGTCVIYVDLDGFKQVNDHYGHSAGDDLLQEVGRILRGCVRDGDLTARVGGDEFAVVIRGIPQGEADAIATRIIERIDTVSSRLPLADLGASVGIAFAEQAEDVSEALRKADQAMYRAKAEGKRKVVHWSSAEGTT